MFPQNLVADQLQQWLRPQFDLLQDASSLVPRQLMVAVVEERPDSLVVQIRDIQSVQMLIQP